MSDWMKKLTKKAGVIAANAQRPKDGLIKMPSPSLNWAMGNGGLTTGKIATFYGPESSGKSLLAMLIMAEALRENPNGIFLWFDTEFSFNPEWAEMNGVDTSRVSLYQTNEPVKIFDYVYKDVNAMCEEGAPIIGMVVDSVKGIRYPKDEKQKSTDLTMGGGGASYLGSMFKHLVPTIRKHNISTLLVQQVYEEMDQYKKMRNPFIVPDGRALKHNSDYMIEVTRKDRKASLLFEGSDISGSDLQIGHQIQARFKKNRVGAPYRTALFTFHYEKGIINKGQEIGSLAKSLGVIHKYVDPKTGEVAARKWTYDGFREGYISGEDNMLNFVEQNTWAQDELLKLCLKVDDQKAKEYSSQIAEESNIQEIDDGPKEMKPIPDIDLDEL
jgi:RecA/RadA recombinase